MKVPKIARYILYGWGIIMYFIGCWTFGCYIAKTFHRDKTIIQIPVSITPEQAQEIDRRQRKRFQPIFDSINKRRDSLIASAKRKVSQNHKKIIENEKQVNYAITSGDSVKRYVWDSLRWARNEE